MLLLIVNCRTDVKPMSARKTEAHVIESKQSSGGDDIIPRIAEYADFESTSSVRVSPDLSDSLMIVSPQVDSMSIKKEITGPKYKNRVIRKKVSDEDEYRWISEKPKTREEAYQWAYKAYKLSLQEEELLACRFIDRALELYENGSLWTEKAKHAYNAGNYEKTIIYCDASLRRNDHWDSEDRKRARMFKYKACDQLAQKYPSTLTEEAAAKAFEEMANE